MDLISRLLVLADDVKPVAEGAKEGGDPSGLGAFAGFVPLILIVVLFYFMILAPQRRQQRDHESMVDALKKGDEILTRGGIYGKVVSVKGDGALVIQSEEARLKVHKNAVAQVLTGGEKNESNTSDG